MADTAAASQTEPTKVCFRHRDGMQPMNAIVIGNLSHLVTLFTSHSCRTPSQDCCPPLHTRMHGLTSSAAPVARGSSVDLRTWLLNMLVPPQAWLLVIQSKFQSIEDRDELISHVKAVAIDSAQNEPTTLGFQASSSGLRLI